MIGIVAYALFILWCCGTSSILVDFDHIWSIIGREPPITLCTGYGRPLHTRRVFIVFACICAGIMVTFGTGFYRGIVVFLGIEMVLLLMIVMNVVTYLFSKRLGKKLATIMLNHKRERRKLNNDRG